MLLFSLGPWVAVLELYPDVLAGGREGILGGGAGGVGGVGGEMPLGDLRMADLIEEPI